MLMGSAEGAFSFSFLLIRSTSSDFSLRNSGEPAGRARLEKQGFTPRGLLICTVSSDGLGHICMCPDVELRHCLTREPGKVQSPCLGQRLLIMKSPGGITLRDQWRQHTGATCAAEAAAQGRTCGLRGEAAFSPSLSVHPSPRDFTVSTGEERPGNTTVSQDTGSHGSRSFMLP